MPALFNCFKNKFYKDHKYPANKWLPVEFSASLEVSLTSSL